MSEDTLYFQLSEKLEYSKGGDFFQTATLELQPPSMKVFDLSSILCQDLMKAVVDGREVAGSIEQNESQDTGDIDSETIKMILFQSKSVKFSDVAKTCKVLFTHVGTYEGKTPIKMAIFDKMNIHDFTDLVCEYIANFIWPSLFSGRADQKKTIGDT